MEPINPYAVMRNTATHEAYKAYSRKAAMAGPPYIIVAFLLAVLTPQVIMTAGRALLNRTLMDWQFVLAAFVVPELLAAVFAILGVVKMLRFRKENPVPDEWRQVPRFNPLRRAGRMSGPSAAD